MSSESVHHRGCQCDVCDPEQDDRLRKESIWEGDAPGDYDRHKIACECKLSGTMLSCRTFIHGGLFQEHWTDCKCGHCYEPLMGGKWICTCPIHTPGGDPTPNPHGPETKIILTKKQVVHQVRRDGHGRLTVHHPDGSMTHILEEKDAQAAVDNYIPEKPEIYRPFNRFESSVNDAECLEIEEAIRYWTKEISFLEHKYFAPRSGPGTTNLI